MAAVASLVVLVSAAGCRKQEKPPDIPSLVAALRDPTRSGPATTELIRIGEPGAPLIGALLSDPDPGIRKIGAQTLWSLGPRAAPAVPQLVPVLGDPDPGVRSAAAMACEAIGPAAAPAVSALTRGLKDKDGSVRQWSAKALGNIGPAASSAIPALAQAAKNDYMRDAAEDALRKIQTPR